MDPLPDEIEFSVVYQHIELKQASAIISFGLITIVILALLLSLRSPRCRKKCEQQNSQSSGRYFFISFIVALLSFYTNCIVGLYMVFNIERITNNETWPPILIISRVPYEYGRLIMEIFFILRLYFIFSPTASGVNPYILSALVISSIISFVLGCLGAITSALKVWKYHSGEVYIPIILAFSGVVIGSIVSGIVVFLFIRILYQINVQMAFDKNAESMVHSYSETESDDDDSKIDDIQIELEDKQIQMIGLITKNTLLGLIGLTSTFTVYFIVIIEWILQIDNDPIGFRMITNIDGAVNSICMYLIFAWSDNVYIKVCYCCDGGIRKYCISITKQSVKREISREMSE